MRTRTGKIARLPATIREELNRRFNNGSLAKDLVPWLNELPDVKRVMNELFGGRPITEDNLSQWRRGGFQDWLRDEERRVRLCQIMERYEELGPEEGARRSEAHFYQWIAAELMTEFERLSTMTDRDERWKRFQKISQELNRLQRARARASAAALQQAKASQLPHSKPTCVQHLAGPRPCNSPTH